MTVEEINLDDKDDVDVKKKAFAERFVLNVVT